MENWNFNTKFPSVIRKPSPIDAVFKDKAKFDTQNSTIDTLLTQIEAGKINQEKQIKKPLETASSIKDLKIAEQIGGWWWQQQRQKCS